MENQDFILPVIPKKEFLFVPGKLLVRPLGSDINAGTSNVYFELSDESIDKSKYLTREWVDKGNVTVPLNLLANVKQGGQYNIAAINAFLSAFNLEVDVNALNNNI